MSVCFDRVKPLVDETVRRLAVNAFRDDPIALPYGEAKRTLQVDIVVYDNLHRSLRTYEVKRGNGQHDAGKVRSIMRDLICTHVLLKSYGEDRGHGVDLAEAKIIYYYGVRSVPAPISLEHFAKRLNRAVIPANRSL